MTVELRLLVSPRTSIDPPVLQYRVRQLVVDASGALCDGGFWKEWEDVPIVVGELPKETP